MIVGRVYICPSLSESPVFVRFVCIRICVISAGGTGVPPLSLLSGRILAPK